MIMIKNVCIKPHFRFCIFELYQVERVGWRVHFAGAVVVHLTKMENNFIQISNIDIYIYIYIIQYVS